MTNPTEDPVLRRFRTALDEIYGSEIDRVVLFGSRARGDAQDDSDYDVAVFFLRRGGVLPTTWRCSSNRLPIDRRSAADWRICASDFWTIPVPFLTPNRFRSRHISTKHP
jgi:predicted nucleotidyltransferase